MDLAELIGTALVFAVVNGLGVLAIDGILALVGLSDFGSASGWLAIILPALLYFDDFRAWRAHRQRWLVGPVSALAGIAIGLLLVGLAPSLPPLASGAIGAVVAVAVYAPMWFLGIRRLTGVRPVAKPMERKR